MLDEYHALIKNKTWTLVPRPLDTNIVRCMWLFRHKYLEYGILSRYKARLVANGSTLLEGIDVDETFSPVVKLGTIQTIFSLAAFRHWPIHQLDVKNAFLHGLSIGLNRPLELGFNSLHRILLGRTPIDTESKLENDGDPVFDLTLYQSLADADWVGCPTTRCSTSGYCVFLGNNLLSWSSKRQSTLFRSSAAPEYRGVAVETCWLRNLLRELHTSLSSITLVYCDNVGAVYLSYNLVQHQRTKHIKIDINFVHDLVAAGQVHVLHVPSRY
uniref:Ribonuclease H-like domain-containing protein n=1 Tax=Tanacetum cinerariifolium TaxID=118510 RepID=A0A699HT98_TANCI|nr:ribonuclease H-like domain-containing protein [Tanacetum cinerariifolium]